MNILVIDIGGSGVKMKSSSQGDTVRRFDSWPEMTPTLFVERTLECTRDWPRDVVSIGYPGRVDRHGPRADPGNLGEGWVGFDFERAFKVPVRIANDAAMQALGAYDGGRMLFLGLGTGLGSVLIAHRVIVPLELGELPMKKATFSAVLGRLGLDQAGKKKWRKALFKAVPTLQRAFQVDYVVLGGGNSKYVKEPLPPGVRLGNNLTAFRGGFRLWSIDDLRTLDADTPHEAPGGEVVVGKWQLL